MKYIPFSLPKISKKEINAVNLVLKNLWLTTGKVTGTFENNFARYIGCKEAVAVNSCTAALHLSLKSLGIGKGDEVITTPFTFAATGNAILYCDAKPVFVDIDRSTLCIDPNKIEEKITRNTKAIIVVHYGGKPCPMKNIMYIAKKHRIHVVEDAAHALGTDYSSKKIGSHGNLTCFSFYPIKNITTGEGGMITTNDTKLAEKIRRLSMHGINKSAWQRYLKHGSWYYEIEDLGFKYNLTDVLAAIGIEQLKKLDYFNEIRRKYARIYFDALKSMRSIQLQDISDKDRTWHLFPIILQSKVLRRNEMVESLKDRNIGCSVHFIPLHLHPLYKNRTNYKKGDFPVCEDIYSKIFSIPLYPGLAIAQVRYIINTIKELLLK